MAEEGSAERNLAAVGAKNLEPDGIEISAEEGAGFVSRGSAEQSEKCFLRQLFGVSRIGDAAAKKAIDGLFVALKEFRESLRGTLRKRKHEPFVAEPHPS